MMQKKRSYWLLGVLLGALLVLVGIGTSAFAQDSTIETTELHTVLLPVVRANFPQPMSLFGVEVTNGHVARTLSKAKAANVTWMRHHSIHWDAIETERGVINWDELSIFESEILTLNQAGITPMVIIHGTPAWARTAAHPDHICGPIRPDALYDFANFLTQIVGKYSKPPFNVHYWELGNEPDVDPDYIPTSYVFGCWGDDKDAYYGAAKYTEMLRVAYPAIKAADPYAQVILGGLLLDCDPKNSPSTYTCTAGNFLEGIFKNGGANYIDIIAYHTYPFWMGTENEDWDLVYPKWQERGGILLGKLAMIREIMAKYHVDKPIIMNEGGLMCGFEQTDVRYETCKTEKFRSLQANYLVRLYIRSWAYDVDGVAWYTLNGPGWREGGLLENNNEPRLSYVTFEFLSRKLQTAQYAHQLSTGGLEGYEFADILWKGKRYQFYWSNTATQYQVSLPPGDKIVYDRYGNSQLVNDTVLTVGFDPVLIEIVP